MVDIGFNQLQTMNMNITSTSFMATTNNSGMAGTTGLGFDDVIDPFIDNDWLQEHNLDILFDLFEQEMGSKNSYDVAANNSSNLFGSSPVTSYLYGTSPTLASVLDLNDWLYYDTPIADIIPYATAAAPTTTTYNCQLQQQIPHQPNQPSQQYGYVTTVDNNHLIESNSQSVSGTKTSGKSSNNFDDNKTKVNGLNNNNNSCGGGSSGRSSSSKKSNHVTNSKKMASINNKLTSNISKLNLNNSNLNNFTNNPALGLDKNVINFVNGDNNHHHHNNNINNYNTCDTNSLTSRMRIKRRSKKGQSEGISLLAKPPLSTSSANNSNISSKNHSLITSSIKSSSVAAGSASVPNNVTGSNNVIENCSRNFEPSPNVAIAHQRQMTNKQIGDKISRMIHSKKQTTIFKVTTSEAICIDRSKQAQDKKRMSFKNTNLLIPIHHKQLEKSPEDYTKSCAIAIEHAYAMRYVN